MDSQSGLVSIIMPAYNAEKFIAQAIQSVLDQTYTNWELIIINDGSKDNTEKIIKSFFDKRIIYIPIEINKGVSNARNIGLDTSHGEFILFFDADDVLPTNSISCRISYFSDSEIYFVDGSIGVYNDDFSSLLRFKKHTFKGNPFTNLIQLDESCFLGLTWLIRSKLVKQPKKIYFHYAHTHGEDLLFFMEITKDKGTYIATEDEVLKYRKHEVSAMSNIDGLQKGYIFILKEIKKWNISPKLINSYRLKIFFILVKCHLKNLNLLKAIKVTHVLFI